MPVITEIEDLKRIYKRRVPKMFYDYAESGSWTEQTFRDNSSDFDEIRLRQRIAVDMDGRSTAAKMVGQDYAMPVALAPVGLCGMQSADGEIKAAGGGEVRRALHAVDHVDLFDRGRGQRTRKTLLVPGLHAARTTTS
jgi:L-lactate dehydrogenase (cytochrome)